MVYLYKKIGTQIDQIHILTAKKGLKNFNSGETKTCMIQMMHPLYIYHEDRRMPAYVNHETEGRIAVFETSSKTDVSKVFYQVFKSIDDVNETFDEPVPIVVEEEVPTKK